MSINITANNFQKEVLESPVPVLLDFWAPWCGPCQMVAPLVEVLSEEVKGRAKIGKINTDVDGQLSAHYGVMSIPTFIVFQNGKEVARFVGVRDIQFMKNSLGV